jgi:mxaJ protein
METASVLKLPIAMLTLAVCFLLPPVSARTEPPGPEMNGAETSEPEMTGLEKIQASKTEFRVCADPDNLPFSNRKGEGFDNKIAELLAKSAGQKLVYDWWPERRGFIKNTLDVWNCDVVLGVPTRDDLVVTTQPYYCSSYVTVYRGGEKPPVVFSGASSEPEPTRDGTPRIGVIERTPPLDIALRHHIEPVVYFTDYGYQGNYPGRIFHDLAEGKIDAALVWGPTAGYFAQHEPVKLDVAPLMDKSDPPLRLSFPISLGVRHGDKARLVRLDALLQQNAAAIEAILTAYGIPLSYDPNDCLSVQKSSAAGTAPLLHLAAATSDGQSSGKAAGMIAQQGNPPASSGPASSGKEASGGKSSVPCNPSETIDDVKKAFPAKQGEEPSGLSQQHPYKVYGNKADAKTYEGWIRFAGFCERCHGPGGIGSAQAPDLAEAIKSLTKPQFDQILRCGLTGNIGIGVMPAWGDNPNIMPYLDDLWSYLQARSDNALGPGRPEKIAQAQQ